MTFEWQSFVSQWKISSSGNHHSGNRHIPDYVNSWYENIYIYLYIFYFYLFNSYLFYFYSFYSLFNFFFNTWVPQHRPMQSLAQTQSILVMPVYLKGLLV